MNNANKMVWLQMPVDLLTTLIEAKTWTKEHADNGVVCPCCSQKYKIYKRALSSTMAHSLIVSYRLFHQTPDTWLHLPGLLNQVGANRANQVGLLRHWGLLERAHGHRDDGSDRVGFYRPTQEGWDFVLGRVTIPKYAILCNQDLIALDTDEFIDIRTALRTHFNYDDMMKWWQGGGSGITP